jgi:hypothetical protein
MDTMSIDAMKQLIPSPLPSRVDHDWEAVERRLGIQLPVNYKDFVDNYGTGVVAEFLAVLSPFTENRNLNLLDKGTEMLAGYRQLHQAHPREYPFEAFPSLVGVFPWAVTDNGDELYWLMEGPPDEWPTIVWATPSGMYERHDTTSVKLIAMWIDGTLETEVLPPDMPALFVSQ